MNQTENLYNILEIKKDATQNEIRVAYKKLALQWHPDKNDDKIFAETKFKKICEAYTVLSNPDKKRLYDLSTSPESFPMAQPFMTPNIFRQKKATPPSPPKEEPKETKKNSVQQQIVKVTLDELFTGCLKKFKIKQYTITNIKPKKKKKLNQLKYYS